MRLAQTKNLFKQELDSGGLFGLRRLFRVLRLSHGWRRFCVFRVSDRRTRSLGSVLYTQTKVPPRMR